MSAKTNCNDFEWMVGPLIDGELPRAEVEEAQKHLDGCPSCTRLAEEFRAFDRLAHRLESPPEVSTLEWARMLESLRREPAVIHLGIRRRILDWMVPALSIAALAILGTFVTVALVTHKETKRLDAASVEVLKEKDNPGIEVKDFQDAVIIKDSTNL